MKNKMILGSLFLAAALLLAPAVTVEAKEIKAGESIPLTAEYFPDEWFLSEVTWYDKNKDGALSPEETAAVNSLWIAWKLTDFSQVQYFTNLRDLEVSPAGEEGPDGVWIGTDIDLTAFPNLESVQLNIDTDKAPAGSPDVRIRASDLRHLKSIRVYGESAVPSKYDGTNVRLEAVDLRNTPVLETVHLSGVRGVKFDDVTKIKELYLFDIKDIPFEQIGGFTELENCVMIAHRPEFRCVDVSKNKKLKILQLHCDYLEEIRLAGADSLEELWIDSPVLQGMDVSGNACINNIQLDCPKLKNLDVSQNKKLQTLWLLECPGLERLNLNGAVSLATLCVKSDRLTALDLRSNKALTSLNLTGNKIAKLDLTKNTKLTDLDVGSKAIKKLDLKKNTKLTRLGIYCQQLPSVDLSKNKNLMRLSIYSSRMKSVDLFSQKKLDYLGIGLKKLKSLDALKLSSKETLTGMRISDLAWKTIDLSKFPKLRDVYLENNQALTKVELSKNTLLKTLKIDGSSKLTKLDLSKNVRLKELEIHGSPKLTKLDLRKNKRLFDVNVSGNGLKAIYLSASKPDLTYFDCRDNKLTSVDLSNVSNSYHTTIWCDKNVKVKGYKGKVYH